jgi:hypothetical protein
LRKTLHDKLNKLKNTQVEKLEEIITFFPRVINNTHITFKEAEMALLNKGLKYNVDYKLNN